MRYPPNEMVVLDIAGARLRVMPGTEAQSAQLSELGFHREQDQMVREAVDETDKLAVIHRLINLNALFSRGRDWAPSELLEYYKEKGVVLAPYRTVGWVGPDNYTIESSR
jgi:hypothetical protein